MDKITQYISEYASGLQYEDIDPDTVAQTKIRMVETMACGLAAFESPVGRIVRAAAMHTYGHPGSTVLGTTHKSSPELATFANSSMVRFLDFNDTYHSLDSGHPSDQIPGVLALAEMTGADGKSLITGIVLAYEVYCRLCDVANVSWGSGKWYNAMWGAIAGAAAASKILGLTPDQTANAISIAVVSHASPGVINKGDQVPLWHPCSDPNAIRQGVFSALLAREGMQGPSKPFEDKKGFFEVISGPFELAAFGSGPSHFRINDTLTKKYTACSHLQTAAEAAIQVHRQVPRGTDVVRVDISTNSHTLEVCARPDRWHPKGTKSAHLSLPFCVAVGLIEGEVGIDQITEEKIRDPEIHKLMQRVQAREDPKFSLAYPKYSQTAIEALDKDGNSYKAESAYTRGFPQDPMDARMADQKFRNLTNSLLTSAQQSEALGWLWDLENQPNVTDLFGHLVIRGKQPLAN